jgi:YD repeat-containing protein
MYNPAGMITKKTLQDGSWTSYSYDALNQLLRETKQTSTLIVYDYAYTYDAVGNRLSWVKNTILGGFWSVDYLNMPSQVLTNMTSAGYGNTASSTQTVALARIYNYDAANRLSNWNYAVNIYSTSFPVQTDGYTYDNNGNRLTKQAVLTGQRSN